MGKGGSKQPQEQTVVQSNLPKYVRPYFERLLQRTEAESKQEYNPYTGQRLAGESDDILQSRQNIRDIASSGIAGLPQAQGATMAGMQRALQGLGYQSRDFDSAAAQQYMSPYMQNVVDVQKQQAIQDFQRGNAGRSAQAIQAGAFGGSRQAVAQGMATKNYRASLQIYRLRGNNKRLNRHSNSLKETERQENQRSD